MREVALIGVGQTAFGELWERNLRDLVTEAGLEAIQNAGISGEDIDALYVGTMSTGLFIGQEHVAPLVLDQAGLADLGIPATRVEASGASGAVALRQAYLAVKSGEADLVVVGGVEKMTDVSDSEAARILGASSDQEWEAFFGATDPALHALIARAHMDEYGTTREALAQVAVKNHAHGALNPKAQFRKELTVDAVVGAPKIAEPLTMFDCAPLADGAAAVVLCPADRAPSYHKKPISLAGSAQASDTLALHARPSLTEFRATRLAAERAFKQSGRKPKDVHVAEVHDCYTINEILAIEDLGFVKKGQGGPATLEGRTRLGGEIPVNTSGGLKARGHPGGATGLAQVGELVTQLRGEGGKRQVKGASVGLAHSTGGTGGTAVVHILEAMR